MSHTSEFPNAPHERRRFHRLRELVRASPESAELVEKLLEALEQVPMTPTKDVAPNATEPLPFHERISLVLQRCQKALQAQGVALWRWVDNSQTLTLVEAIGLNAEKLEPFLKFAPRLGHPIHHACKQGIPQRVTMPNFMKSANHSDVTLPPYAIYVPVLAGRKSLGVMMLSSDHPMMMASHASLSELGTALGQVLSIQPV